jgi:hypothetical protein
MKNITIDYIIAVKIPKVTLKNCNKLFIYQNDYKEKTKTVQVFFFKTSLLYKCELL